MFLMIVIFGRLFGLAFKMTWGVVRILFTLVFLPLVLIGLIIGGIFYIAIPALIIIGIISLITSLARTI